MMKYYYRRAAAFIILAGFFLAACGVNGDLTVYNKTDKKVSLYYEYEDDDDEGGSYRKTSTMISPGDKKTITVNIDIAGEGTLRTVYGGIVRPVTVNFGFDERAKLYLYTNDFYDYILGL